MNHQYRLPRLTPFAQALAAALATMVRTVTFAADCVVAGSIAWSADNCDHLQRQRDWDNDIDVGGRSFFD